MLSCSVLLFCLMVIGVQVNATSLGTADNFSESSVNISDSTTEIDNFTGIYAVSKDLGSAITATMAATTEKINILSVNEQVENNTRFICGKHNPCHWQVYTRERQIEIDYPSVCDCPNNTVCRYYTDDISIRAFEYRCTELTPTSAKPETSNVTETSSADSA